MPAGATCSGTTRFAGQTMYPATVTPPKPAIVHWESMLQYQNLGYLVSHQLLRYSFEMLAGSINTPCRILQKSLHDAPITPSARPSIVTVMAAHEYGKHGKPHRASNTHTLLPIDCCLSR